MGRLIEDTALMDAIRAALRADQDDMSAMLCNGIETVVLKYVPTVDAVPVVRCKDCEWWTKQDKSLQGRCARYGTYPTGAWFCAAGRKDGNGNGKETDRR